MYEYWKDIKGYEGLYQASNFGRIKSLCRIVSGKKRKGKILSCTNSCGYPIVTLCKDGKRKPRRIHRIIAETFIDNPMNLPEVNHIDGNKNNNCTGNLEWCTGYDNKLHAWKNGLTHQPVITEKPIEQLFENKVIANYASIKIASEINNIHSTDICKCCRGKRLTAGGFGWRYKEG